MSDELSLFRGPPPRRRRGFTLIELLVVIAIIAILIAILLPAVQQAREAARRSACNNNMKQLGLALHNYHDTHKVFPIGSTGTSAAPWHSSWMMHLLPYIEYENVYDRLVFTGAVPIGYPAASAPASNRDALDRLLPTVYWCPSSDLPKEAEVDRGTGAIYCQTTYVGVSGAVTSATDFTDPTGKGRCANADAVSRGYICANGMLNPNHSIAIGQVRDGTTFTIMVGEQSGWLVDSTGAQRDIRASSRDGWPEGTGLSGWPGGPGSASWGTSADARPFNLTTVRYPIGHKTTSAGMTGDNNQFQNSSIRSIHRGGAFVMRVDGGTKFLSDGTDFTTFRWLAIRDDRQVIRSNPLE